MDKDLARNIIRAAFRSGGELEALLPVLKNRCTAEDYARLVRQVAIAVDGIHTSLVRDMLRRFPDLETEIEAGLKRSGRAIP